MFCIGGFQHLIPSAGICIPFTARGQVDRTKLPLPQRVLDARLKATLLFLVADFSQNLMSWMPVSTMYFSTLGQT
jgi:hypothetical protein